MKRQTNGKTHHHFREQSDRIIHIVYRKVSQMGNQNCIEAFTIHTRQHLLIHPFFGQSWKVKTLDGKHFELFEYNHYIKYLNIGVYSGEGQATFIKKHQFLCVSLNSWIHQNDFLSLAPFTDRVKHHKLNIDSHLGSREPYTIGSAENEPNKVFFTLL